MNADSKKIIIRTKNIDFEAKTHDKFFSSVSTHEANIVADFEWKAKNNQFFPKMDVLKFSVKLSSGGFFQAVRLGYLLLFMTQ